MRKILTSIGVTALSLTAAACGSSDESGSAQSDLPTVVVTTSILGDIVESALGDIVGQQIDVEVIVPVGADAHEFAASARQAETMENAALLVVNGLGYEEGMTDTIANALDAGATGFVVAGILEPQEDGDPHVWLDPVRIADALEALPAAIAETTDVSIDEVTANVQAYLDELDRLDAAITEMFSDLPVASRNLVTNHDALRQFADRYDFTIVDTIIPSMSSTAQASAADLEDVVDSINTYDVPAIFADSTSSDDLAQALVDEVGREVSVVELFTESLDEPGTDAGTYVGMMTVNAERIAAALG